MPLEITDRQRVSFWAKAVADESGCLIWQRGMVEGYGKVRIGTRIMRAPRVAYLLERGDIPEGMTVDHTCCVRACINPAHLELVTAQENVYRAYGSDPACYPCGHSRDVNEKRCVECRRARIRRYGKRRRAALSRESAS